MTPSRDDQLGEDAARELEAIDRALDGETLEPEQSGIATLVADLRAERPQPSLTLEEELERLRARGFQRRSPRRLRQPRTYLAPLAGLATLAAIAVAVVTVTPSDTDNQVLDGSNGLLAEDTVRQSEPSVPEPPFPEGGFLPDGERLAGGRVVPFSRAGAAQVLDSDDARVSADLGLIAPAGGDRSARGTDKRREDRSAAVVLGTDTDRVREVSDQVIQITRSSGGVVVNSNVSEDTGGAVATMQLQIPTKALDPSLDQITDLANVESLNEASVDITRPFVSAQDSLKDARAERQELLEALGNAETDLEADALQQRIDDSRREISRAEARFQNIARQARLSDISVRVEGTPNGDDDGKWSLGDAADDALSTLKTVAGVILVAAAILAPLAILALVTFLAAKVWRRRRRQGALGE